MRLGAVSANGSGSLSLPSRQAGSASVRGLADLRLRVQSAVAAHPDGALQVVLLAIVGVVLATNLSHWPANQFDEGTYVSNAWALQHGKLAPYTYSYGHPPLVWLLIAGWTWVTGIFGHAGYSIDGARGFMIVVNLVSCSLLYTLARRLGIARAFAVGAVILFALSPLDILFHRAVLLDNPSIAWALAAFVLALTPQRRLWAFAASGACFAASVLCKETTLILLPALIVAAGQNSDRRTRRYCLTLFISMLFVIAASYPLYAALKGELLPGQRHVSLLGNTLVQLFTRKGTGSFFDPASQTHAIVTTWLRLDPWLLGAALALSPVALARGSTRAVAVAYLAQVVTVFRPGYLPNMYVIGLLPFAALIVAGSADAVWRRWRRITSRAGAWLVGGIIGAPALVVVAFVAGRWAQTDRVAMTARADTPTLAAQRWLVDHVDHQKRLIVGDEFWLYLVQHGFDHHAVRGGFFSRTVVSYWPLDYDPAVKRQFPDAWRDFDYIVSTEAIRDTTKETPTAAAALVHSRVIVTFGAGTGRIEIRAITREAVG
jgi:4-amino-4-deoxy-L-arabinose transferase-like glycosyltransferase